MQVPSMDDKNNIVYRRYHGNLTPEYITIVGDKIISSINPESRLCINGGIELTFISEVDKVIDIILGNEQPPYENANYLRNPMNYELAVKLLSTPKTTPEQEKLIEIINTLETFTSTICKSCHKPISGGCLPKNCKISVEKDIGGYHCQLCQAKNILNNLRDSKVLLEK